MCNPCLFACARYTYLYQGSDRDQSLLPAEFVRSLFCPQHVVLNTSVPWQDRLWQSAAECDTHCELLDQWTILTSQKVIASQSSSARVIIYIMCYNLFFKKVAEQELQSTECLGTEGQDPGGTDPIDLQLPRGATGNSREQSTPQSTAPVTRLMDRESLLQVTLYQRDNDNVFSCFSFEKILLCSFFCNSCFHLSLFISLSFFLSFFFPP